MTAAETHAQFHRFQQNREKQWAPKIEKVLNEQFKEFMSWYYGGGLQDSLFRVTSVSMYQLIKAIRIDAATIYGAKVVAYLPKLPKKQIKSRPTMGHNQRMIDLVELYFNKEILATAEGITETTREEIQRILKEANKEGKGITWIAKQMEMLNANRALLIARTETVTAANSGGFIAALEVGLMMQKQWLATNDTRTRQDHVFVNGSKVGMLDYFQVGDNTMLYPGDRTQENGLPTSGNEVINCRCTVQYIPQRVDGKLVPFDYSQFRDLVL